MPTDDNKIIATTVCVWQYFTFIQCNNFVSVTDQLVGLLNERLLICTFTFHALWFPEHCVQSDHLV